MAEILRTKLFIPRPRKNLVFRPELVDRLNAGLEKKLTLLAAPAGFGKTTLLSDWIPKSPRRVTWLSLDEGDDDPAQFWAYFIASLQELHPDLGASALTLIQSHQVPSSEYILTELINDLAAFSSPFASVLDDYHFIESQPIHEGLSFLVDHLPGNMHLVIATREDPDLPLARLKARNELNEIRARDLRFTPDETNAFLRGVMGLDLSRQEVAALEDRTEGWVVGLQLAGLSLQYLTNPREFIADFSGSNRHILDYLSDEVLQRQPEQVRNFLLQTAILDRLCGPLCDAIIKDGLSLHPSSFTLEYLERTNLFLVPLDNEGRWYRYHHLFSDLLRNQLARTQPELVPELHRRASQWFEENGDIQAAIEHALQDIDMTRAARLVEQHALPSLYRGEVAQVVGWFERLPEATLQASPMLCIGKAWALVLMQRNTRGREIEQALQAAELALERVNASEALRNLVAGHVASIQAYLLQRSVLKHNEPQRLVDLSQKAQRLLPAEEKAIRSVNALNTGYGFLAQADLDAANQAFKQALEDGLAGGNYYAAIYGPINLVINTLLVGKMREALQLCETNIQQFNQILAGQNFPPIGALLILKGSILLEFNRLVEAEQALTEGLDLVHWTGESVSNKKGYTALARLHAIRGDRPAMLEAVKTLEETWPEQAFYAQALRHRLSLRHWPGDLQARQDAQAWLWQSGVEFDKLGVISSVAHGGVDHFETILNTVHVLVRLAIGIPGPYQPGAYRLDEAHTYLQRQREFAERHGIGSWVVAIAIARTLLLVAAGKKREALETLGEALRIAEYTGLFRGFLDECEPLQALMKVIAPRLPGEEGVYARLLVESMLCGPALSDARDHHPGLLSERELEVLRFLASGLGYAEIGQRMFLSLNTIQFHVKHIYRKLLVNNRVKAIEQARELNLI